MAKTKIMLTPKQYAEQTGAAYSTVMVWLRRGLLPGAVRHDMPSGGCFYEVPANAPKPTLPIGRKPKKADADVKPAKKTRKRS